MECSPPGSSVNGDSPGKNTGEGCHFLLQGIFETQGSNPGLQRCRWTLCHLSHQGSPILTLHSTAFHLLISSITIYQALLSPSTKLFNQNLKCHSWSSFLSFTQLCINKLILPIMFLQHTQLSICPAGPWFGRISWRHYHLLPGLPRDHLIHLCAALVCNPQSIFFYRIIVVIRWCHSSVKILWCFSVAL